MLTSEHRYLFPADPAAVWSAMGDVGRFRSWWPWLTSFEGKGLVAGDRWSCRIQPPLPYSLRFEVELVDLCAGELIAASVSGDVHGEARLELAPHPSGCAVRLRSSLRPTNWALALTSRLGGPLVRRAHAHVLDLGARQFVELAL